MTQVLSSPKHICLYMDILLYIYIDIYIYINIVQIQGVPGSGCARRSNPRLLKSKVCPDPGVPGAGCARVPDLCPRVSCTTLRGRALNPEGSNHIGYLKGSLA